MIEQVRDHLKAGLRELVDETVGLVSTALMFGFGVLAWIMLLIASVSRKPGDLAWPPFWSIGGLICVAFCLFFGFFAMVWLYRSAKTGQWLRRLREGFQKYKPNRGEYVQYALGVMCFMASCVVFVAAVKPRHTDAVGACLAFALFYGAWLQLLRTGSNHEKRLIGYYGGRLPARSGSSF